MASLLDEGGWDLLASVWLDSWSPFAHRLRDPCAEKRRIAREVLLRYHHHDPECRRVRQRTIVVLLLLTSGMLVLFVVAAAAIIQR